MTAPEVVSRLKPALEACVCGCGVVNRPKVKAFKDGLGPHARGCPCRRCTGRNVKRTSGNRERRVARKLGGTREPFSGALSGVDIVVYLRGAVRLGIEETTHQAVRERIEKAIASKAVQDKIARLMAQRDGLRALVMPEWALMPRKDFEDLVALARPDDI